MSSDDDLYDLNDNRYDRNRSSNRARRRGSAQSHRRRRFNNGYANRKSRRGKLWYFQNTPRLMAACMFLFLLAYEVVILKGPLAKKETTPSTHAASSKLDATHAASNLPVDDPVEENTPKHPLHPVAQPKESAPAKSTSDSNLRTPVSLESGSTVADRIKAASKVVPSQATADPAPYRPLRKHKRTSARTDSIKFVQDTRPAPASALALESKPADAEENGPEDPDVPSKKSRGRRSSRSRRQSPSRSNRLAGTSSDAGADIDVNPPASRKQGKVGEGGADPGAGENFWQWFQETKGSEKGTVSSSIKCPEEYKRLCTMFYKYLRKYKIRSIFDASCAVNLDWMPDILRKAGNELWGFKYYCGITEEAKMEAAKEKMSSLNFVEFAPDLWWRDGFPEDTELLFAWDTLPHMAYGRVWNFFVKAKKQEIKYILVDNYPGIMNDPSPKRNYLNLRKHPFRFPAAKEVVQNVTEPGETAKRQLLFYEGAMLPDNLQ